jgi:hypothetical protein
MRVHEIGRAYFPQDRGQQNIGDGKFRAGDPFAAIEAALHPAQKPVGQLDPKRAPFVRQAGNVAERDKRQRRRNGAERGEASLCHADASLHVRRDQLD